MRPVRTIVLAALALVVLTGATPPGDAASVASTTGYFIEDGADATDEVVGGAVSDARNAGSLFYAIVLAEEPPSGATTYAEAVLSDVPNGEGTVLTVAPETIGWAKNNSRWTVEELNEATEASLEGETSDEVVRLFVDSLLGVESSGGGGGFPWFLVIVLAVVVGIGFLIWRGRRNQRASAAAALADLKATAESQIAAVANDILADEQEIGEAGNPDASERFDQATAIYADAAERLQAATTPREVLQISADLDQAIWHLDCAEAILDGEPLPPKPEPPKPPADPTPASASAPQDGGGALPPLPQYQRRASRRSSFGADDMMRTMIAMQAMRSIGGSRRRGSSSRSGSSSASRSRSPGRARGGARRRK